MNSKMDESHFFKNLHPFNNFIFELFVINLNETASLTNVE